MSWTFTGCSDRNTGGVHAHGGSLNGAGPAIVNGMLFVNTGYTNAVAGNVLLAFAVDRGDQQQKQVEAANHQAASALDLTSADNQASSEQRALHYKGWSIRIPASNLSKIFWSKNDVRQNDLVGSFGNFHKIRPYFRRSPLIYAKPIQLTAGPLNFGHPLPSKDGKKIFAIGGSHRAEVIRYDSRSNQFVPYLSGISAEGLAFSRDGQWVTYTSYPEGALVSQGLSRMANSQSRLCSSGSSDVMATPDNRR